MVSLYEFLLVVGGYAAGYAAHWFVNRHPEIFNGEE